MDVFERIREERGSFSKSFTKVADYICSNYEEAAFMSVFEVAKQCGVSESVVVRFSAYLGFSGFVELKRSLAAKVKNNLQLPTRMTSMEAMTKNLMDEEIMAFVINRDIENLLFTLKDPYNKNFGQIVDELHNAKQVFVIGNRGLFKIAELTEFLFDLAGIDCISVNAEDSYEFRKLRKIHKNCVLLAISFPRYNNHVNIALQTAKKKKAKTIVISDSAFSADAAIADYSLTATVLSFSFVNSYCAIISLINAIVTAIGIKYREETMTSLCDAEDWLHIFKMQENYIKNFGLHNNNSEEEKE